MNDSLSLRYVEELDSGHLLVVPSNPMRIGHVHECAKRLGRSIVLENCIPLIREHLLRYQHVDRIQETVANFPFIDVAQCTVGAWGCRAPIIHLNPSTRQFEEFEITFWGVLIKWGFLIG